MSTGRIFDLKVEVRTEMVRPIYAIGWQFVVNFSTV